MIRLCTVCSLNGTLKVASYVATNAEGMQWYECGDHGIEDHPLFAPRVQLEPLCDLQERVKFAAFGLPDEAAVEAFREKFRKASELLGINK